MKIIGLAFAALAIGIAAGVYCTQAEFEPTDVPLSVRVAQGTASDLLLGNRQLGSPKAVVVNGERYSFGSMDRNQKLAHEFVVRNEGQAPLTLVRGPTSCKCTTSKLVNGQVPPGGETRIRLEWNAKTADVSFEQSAQFTTNDPNRPVLHFLIYGKVVDTVRAEPGQVTLGEISATETSETSVNIYGYRNTPIEMEKITWGTPATAEFYDVSFEPIPPEQLPTDPPAANGLTMKVTMKPGLPIGNLDQVIRLKTNLQTEPLEINLHGKVVGDIRVVGPGTSTERLFVVLPTATSKQGLQHTVFLIVKGSHRDEAELRVSSVEPAGELQATLGDPIRDNPRVLRFPLHLEIPAGTNPVSRVSPGSYAKIRLDSPNPQFKEVVIEVRYLVQE